MNYFVAIWCLLAVTASIKADGGLGLGGPVYAPGYASTDYYAYPRYAFEYAVRDPKTGDNKAQWEKRDGDVVRGAYSLVEPDGNLRVVEYWADDKSGFNAVVKRTGPNLHPAVIPAAPIYKAPIPLLNSAAIAAPISIGSVAGYSGLASAPLITGPLGLGGAAFSTASVIKAAPIAIAAPVAPVVAPIAPFIRAPIIKPALGPLEISPLLSTQVIKSSPYLGNLPWGSLPGPIISAPAPILKGPVGIPAVSLGDGLIRGPVGGYNNIGLGLGKVGYNNIGLGDGLIRGPIGGYNNIGLGLGKVGYNNIDLGLAKGGYDDLGTGLLARGGYDYGVGLAKGPIIPAVGNTWGSPIVSNLGWKH